MPLYVAPFAAHVGVKTMSIKQSIIEPLALLPHGKELQSYLITLACAISGKKTPPDDYIHDLQKHSGIFVDSTDIDNILERIRNIYQNKGYRTPWELENDLIREIMPDMPDEALAYADQYAAIRCTPDPLTGYFQKSQVPLVMAMSALYGQTTGQPVSVIEIDWSNMRGTNDHYAYLLAAAEEIGINVFIEQEAMSLTDQATYITACRMRNAITEFTGKKTIVPLRTGGDEARILLPGVTLEQANALIARIHELVEQTTAILDLHDHPHGKRPLDKWSNGYGACATAFALKAEGQEAYEQEIHEADIKIQAEKITLGKNRLTNPDFADLKPPCSHVPECYRNRESAQMHIFSVLERMADLRESLTIDIPESPEPPSLEEIAAGIHLDHFPTPAQIQETYYQHMKDDLAKDGITLTPAQERLLWMKFIHFPATDHTTGTLTARDLPAMAGVAYRMANDINTRTGLNAPLWTISASFHNLAGLNESVGHEAANAVLHHQAHEIIEKTLFRAGLSRENFYLSHMGGGEFRMVIQPIIFDQDGSTRMIVEKIMHTVCNEIKEKTEILNRQYAHIENPREELRPWEDGITVTTVAKPYKIDPQLNTNELRRGGAIVAFIGEHLADAVDEKRKNRIPYTHDMQSPTREMF